jgi:hypothetical protein
MLRYWPYMQDEQPDTTKSRSGTPPVDNRQDGDSREISIEIDLRQSNVINYLNNKDVVRLVQAGIPKLTITLIHGDGSKDVIEGEMYNCHIRRSV